jgi:hypothetical protein
MEMYGGEDLRIGVSAMSLVSVHNEWDPLEEMIVGIPDNARVPIAQKDLFALEYNEHHKDMAQIPSGPYHPQVIEETREDLEALVTVLKQEGVTVRRPQVTDHSTVFSSPDWQSDGEYNYCPRDLLLPIGETIKRLFQYQNILTDRTLFL